MSEKCLALGENLPLSIAQTLKIETATAHRAVEAAFNLAATGASRSGYVRTLQQLHRAHSCARQSLETSTATNRQFLLRELDSRLARLDADLRYLGSTRPSPLPFHLPLGGTYEVLGCEYVVRGSALGGAVIFKSVRKRLGLTHDAGASFFAGDVSGPQLMFAEFKERLEAETSEVEDLRRIVMSANSTFRLFETCLDTRGSSGPRDQT